jgi:RHS repeat-associated protein
MCLNCVQTFGFPPEVATDVNSTRKDATTGTFYWKFPEGSTQVESDLGGNWTSAYGLIGGQIISRVDLPADVVHYYFHDHLHSTNIVTDCCGNILNESDYLPYGVESQITDTDSNHYKFTGKERDTESGLDYFGARYYASSMGRWLSPDKPFADQHTANPQSWNLYAYGRNNPLRNVDPNGLAVLQAVVAEAVSKINSLSGGTLYIDFAGIQGLHSHPSLNASNNFNNWHSDHFDSNSVIIPNNGILSGFFRALFGLANKDQVDTGNAIVAAAKASGQDIAFDTYSNGVNAAGQVAQGMSAGDLQSATVVGPNANSPAPVQAMDQADLGNTLIFVSGSDPALALALFGSQSVSDWASQFPGRVFDPGQPSHNLNQYQNAVSGNNEIQDDMNRQCALGNPAACN